MHCVIFPILASWGIPTAPQPGVPGVYANVAYFMDWVKERTQALRDTQGSTLAFPRPPGIKPKLVEPNNQ